MGKPAKVSSDMRWTRVLFRHRDVVDLGKLVIISVLNFLSQKVGTWAG